MKIKITTRERIVVPDIYLRDYEKDKKHGERVENRSLPAGTRVKAETTLANPEKHMQHIGTRYETILMEAAIRKHVHRISGCLSEWYRDGHTLWDGPDSMERDALIISLFYRILGMKDDEESFNDDGPSELS